MLCRNNIISAKSYHRFIDFVKDFNDEIHHSGISSGHFCRLKRLRHTPFHFTFSLDWRHPGVKRVFLLMLPTATEILRRVPDGHPFVTDLKSPLLLSVQGGILAALVVGVTAQIISLRRRGKTATA